MLIKNPKKNLKEKPLHYMRKIERKDKHMMV